MTNCVLIVVDMQNDFITGVLGTPEARQIVPRCVQKINDFNGTVILTQDTHHPGYLATQEGVNLPVEHCFEGTDGWLIEPDIAEAAANRHAPVIMKPTFGSLELAADLVGRNAEHSIDSITFVGVCTDICVVTNALITRTVLPEVPLFVDATCCAGSTPQAHEAALTTMASCQVHIRS